MLWMSVLDEAISRVTENPAKTSSAIESQKLREREKRTRATPKQLQATAIHPGRPLTLFLVASMIAPQRAPTPGAPISRPSPLAPPCSTWSAKTGISTTHGVAIKLMSPNNSMSARTGAVRVTKRKPSMVFREP